MITNGFSSAPTRWKIETGHYNEAPEPVEAKPEHFIPEGGPFANASDYEIPMGISFKTHPNVPVHRGGMDYGVDYTIVGQSAFLRTASNVFKFSVRDIQTNGLAMNLEDVGIEDWIRTSVGPHAIAYVKKSKFTGLIVARCERQSEHQPAKYITDILEYDGDNNGLGRALSMAENLRQAWNRYKQSREGIENDDHITYLGVTSIKGVLYSIVRLENGEIMLSVGINSCDYRSKEAEHFGLTLEEITNVNLLEEDKHDERKSYDIESWTSGQRVEEERATKQEVLEHYKRLAEGETDPKRKERYERVIRAIEYDIETIDRYKQMEEDSEEKSSLEKTVDSENEVASKDTEDSQTETAEVGAPAE